ncbi:hypothetical protein ACJMK2_042612, partial [Sinanodonta woodiana]
MDHGTSLETATFPGKVRLGWKIYEHVPENITELMLEFLYLTWRKGQIPKIWKTDLIIPIPKPGKRTLGYRL